MKWYRIPLLKPPPPSTPNMHLPNMTYQPYKVMHAKHPTTHQNYGWFEGQMPQLGTAYWIGSYLWKKIVNTSTAITYRTCTKLCPPSWPSGGQNGQNLCPMQRRGMYNDQYEIAVTTQNTTFQLQPAAQANHKTQEHMTSNKMHINSDSKNHTNST